jgi:hypothetical protein
MPNYDAEKEQRARDQSEHHRRVGETISRASTVLREKMSLDLDIADSDLKYSEWMAALSTAGLAIALSTFDKLHTCSWLHSCQAALNAGLGITCVLFVAATGFSALVLRLFRSYRAGFNSTRTLGSAQEVLLLNHVPVFSAQAEVDALLADYPSAFFLDVVYNDIVDRKGGGLVRMAYESKTIDPNDPYEKQQTAKEFGRLAEELEGFKNQFEEIEKRQLRDRKWLSRLGNAQRSMIGLAYLAMVILHLLGRSG